MNGGDRTVEFELLTEVAEQSLGGADLVTMIVGEITDAAYHAFFDFGDFRLRALCSRLAAVAEN